MKYIFILSLWVTALAATTPSFQTPYCPPHLNRAEKEAERTQQILDAYHATQAPYTSSEGIWDPAYLAEHPVLVKALNEFSTGKRGQQTKKIQLEGKTAEELHQELLKKGFHVKHLPLVALRSQKTYWLTTGEQTKDLHHPKVVLMHVYTHPDGSIVRIKAAGIPDAKGRTPRRAPNVIKAVLLTFDSKTCTKAGCPYDLDYDNEAFKVSPEGHPLPKAPSPRFGLKCSPNSPATCRVLQTVVATLGHTPLKGSCPKSLAPLS